MKHNLDLKHLYLKAGLCVFISSLKSLLSSSEVKCKIMPGSVSLSIKLIVLKLVDCKVTQGIILSRETNIQSGDLGKGIIIPTGQWSYERKQLYTLGSKIVCLLCICFLFSL